MRNDRILPSANSIRITVVVGAAIAAVGAIASPTKPQSTTQGPSVEEIRLVADGVIDDVLHSRRHALYSKMCQLGLPSESDLGRAFDMMDGAFGKLLEVKFSSSSEGWFADMSFHSHKQWTFDYLARTSTSPMGTYHATVRVLMDPVVCVQSYNVLRYIPLNKAPAK